MTIPGIRFPRKSGRSVKNYTISASTTNANLFTIAGSPTVAADYVFTINSGVIVGSPSTGTAALVTGTFPVGSTVKLINNGKIYGMGGNGGNNNSNLQGNVGASGGHAISLGFAISIDNTNGNIFGGGGGGGSGGGASYTYCLPKLTENGFGGGGGGGQGYGTSAGGSGYTNIASPGTVGNQTAPGIGGTGGGSSGCSTYGGSGGNGGGWGVSGSTGGSGTSPGSTSPGGAGGAGGNAVKLNGYSITWIAGNNGTQVKGAIS